MSLTKPNVGSAINSNLGTQSDSSPHTRSALGDEFKPTSTKSDKNEREDDSLSIHPNEIWLFLDSLVFGGIEAHVLELAQGLLSFNKSVRVILLTQYSPEPAIIAKLTEINIPYSYLADLSPQYTSSFHQLKSACDTYCPSLIHAHGYKASLISKWIKPFAKNKLKQLSTYHAGETPKGKVWLYDFIDRYSSFLSDHSLVVSRKIQQKVPSKSSLLNNFVTLPASEVIGSYQSKKQQHRKPRRNQVGFVGRLSHEKAADRFLTLAALSPQCSFHLFGDGPERQTLQNQKSDNLVFHGHQTDMSQVWSQIDVLVIPSRYEGLPMAALEAMARGIPVIAMAVGNLPDLIQHEVNGFIAHDESELHQLLIDWLALTEEKRHQLAENAQHTIKQDYSPEAVIPQLLSCYKI